MSQIGLFLVRRLNEMRRLFEEGAICALGKKVRFGLQG